MARRHLLAQVDLLVDVGANQGQYGQAVREGGSTVPILSFEPNPKAFKELVNNKSRFLHWECRQAALGPEVGVASLRIAQNSVSSSFYAPTESHVKIAPQAQACDVVEVPVTTLDQELAGNELRKALKIDVQGAEMAVLQGGQNVLTTVSVIEIELSLVASYVGGAGFLELATYLADKDLYPVAFEPALVSRKALQLQVDGLFARRNLIESLL